MKYANRSVSKYPKKYKQFDYLCKQLNTAIIRICRKI